MQISPHTVFDSLNSPLLRKQIPTAAVTLYPRSRAVLLQLRRQRRGWRCQAQLFLQDKEQEWQKEREREVQQGQGNEIKYGL